MKSTDRPVRIGVFTKPLDNWKSGSGHHLDELMRHVLELNDGRFEFTFIHYKKSENPIYQRVRELIIPRNPLAASAVLRREKFDIIHYAPISIFTPIWFVPAKKIATIHGVEEMLYPQGYSLTVRLHERFIFPFFARRMDAVATVSETSKNCFVERYKIKRERIFVTTNGLGDKYRPLSGKERELPEGCGIDRKFILHISNFSMRKNPVTIINGFARLVKKHGLDYQLVCAGNRWNSDAVRAMAADAGVADRLVTPGFITEEFAVQLLNNAEAFVFPSFAEGFGMPNVEAMACGCPVVTSSIFAIPEVVGDAAVMIKQVDSADELAEAIYKIISDPEFKKDLIKKGFERVPRYNWKDSAESLLKGYERLMQNPDERKHMTGKSNQSSTDKIK